MVCVQHRVCVLLCIAQHFGVDLPFGSAEHAVITIGDAVGPTERAVLQSATRTVANKLFTINLIKERSALTNTHAYIIQMVTHTQASYKRSHTRRHHTNGHTHTRVIQMVTHTHTHTHASYKQSHTRAHGHTHIHMYTNHESGHKHTCTHRHTRTRLRQACLYDQL